MSFLLKKFEPEMSLAFQAAKKAGDRILDIYNKDFSAEFRDGEPVTQADITSHQSIINDLSQTNLLIVSEEDLSNLPPRSPHRFWLIDPLDGTSDFVNKTGEFSVMIALIEQGAPILAAIYWPTTKTFYIGQKNKGSFQCTINHCAKIKVSEVSNSIKSRALVSRHHLEQNVIDLLDSKGMNNIRKHGSAGLKMALVASGQAEVYLTMTDKMSIWDTAAGDIIVTEAGGKVVDFQGQKLRYDIGELKHLQGVVVSNNKFGF